MSGEESDLQKSLGRLLGKLEPVANIPRLGLS